MTRIGLVVSDMAGTTVSDGGIVEAAFLDALDHLGIGEGHPDRAGHLEVVRDTMGMSKIVVFRRLFGDEDRAQAANRAFEDAFAGRVRAGEVAALPGAADAIDRLRAAGIKVCLTTGFSATTRDAIIDHLGWSDRVDLALSPGDGLRGRPFPDMILAAVIRLGIEDVRAVAVVGDTANDLRSGHRAGASIVVGVLTGAHDRATLEAAPHTHVVGSFADLGVILPSF